LALAFDGVHTVRVPHHKLATVQWERREAQMNTVDSQSHGFGH
jgi:hypothetical protein